MLRPKNLSPITILISTSLHPRTRPNFHAKNCQLFHMYPHHYGCRNNAHRNRRKKSRTDNMVGRQEAGPILSPRFESGSQSPELTYNKGGLYLFPPSKVLAVPWDRVQQAGLLQSPQSPAPLLEGLLGSVASLTDGQREKGQK